VGKGEKVVIDTNVFVSAFGWGGTPLKVIELLEN
jgi:predicted nucleic acid-binding protein